MPTIASSATAVLIAHVAAHTSTIRLGAGGVMLPNHAPLVDRRAVRHPRRPASRPHRSGPRPRTRAATRPPCGPAPRSDASERRFPQDVLELQAFLGDESRSPESARFPAKAPTCPSISSARRPSARSLPPARAALRLRLPLRTPFSRIRHRDLSRAIPTVRPARSALRHGRRRSIGRGNLGAGMGRVRRCAPQLGPQYPQPGGPRLSLDEVDMLLGTPRAAMVDEMLHYSAVGTPDEVVAYLDSFQRANRSRRADHRPPRPLGQRPPPLRRAAVWRTRSGRHHPSVLGWTTGYRNLESSSGVFEKP